MHCVTQYFLLVSALLLLLFLVSKLCPSLPNSIDVSPPGSSVPGILQAKILEWGNFLLQGIFQTQGLSLGLLHCRRVLYPLSHQGSPLNGEKGKIDQLANLLTLTIHVS